MRCSNDWTQVVGGKRYSTKTATLLCGDDWWDGHNHERSGTNSWLYRTPKGAYFMANMTQWQGGHDNLTPCSQEEAYTFFEYCEPHGTCKVGFEEAFPGIAIPDA